MISIIRTDDGEFYQGQIHQDLISMDFNEGPDTGYSKSFVDVHEKMIFDSYDKAISMLAKRIRSFFSQKEVRQIISKILEGQ